MKFIKDTIKEMKLTEWPTKKASVRDFFLVVEYTFFFMLFIMAFDWISKNGVTSAVQHLLPFIPK